MQVLYERNIAPGIVLWVGGERNWVSLEGSETRAMVGGGVAVSPWLYGETSIFLGDGGKAFQQVKLIGTAHLNRHWIAQPRIEMNFAAQDDYAQSIASGLVDVSLALRLRSTRKGVAPFAGVIWTSAAGGTAARLQRAKKRSLGRYEQIELMRVGQLVRFRARLGCAEFCVVEHVQSDTVFLRLDTGSNHS